MSPRWEIFLKFAPKYSISNTSIYLFTDNANEWVGSGWCTSHEAYILPSWREYRRCSARLSELNGVISLVMIFTCNLEEICKVPPCRSLINAYARPMSTFHRALSGKGVNEIWCTKLPFYKTVFWNWIRCCKVPWTGSFLRTSLCQCLYSQQSWRMKQSI